MRRFPMVQATLIAALLVAGLTPASAAELPYISQVRKGTEGGEPRLIVATSAKLELVMLVAARADRQQAINRPRSDNPMGGFWNARSQPLSFDEAPRHLRELRPHGLWGDRLLEFALHLSDPPALEQVLPWSDALLDAARGESAEDPAAVLEALRLEIKSFAEKMRFQEHYATKKDDYSDLAENLKLLLGERDPLAQNAAFWGVEPKGDLYLILSTVLSGGYLAEVRAGERNHQFLAFGPALPGIVVPPYLLEHLIHHELSHLIVDPVLNAAATELESSGALLPPIVRGLQGISPMEKWTDAVGEHLLRAYNIYLLEEDLVLAELSVTSEEANGYLYTRTFLDMIHEYAGNREEWTSVQAYMPQMVARLKSMAANARELDPENRSPEFTLKNAGFEAAGNGWLAKDWSLLRAGDLPGSAGGVFTEVARDTAVAHDGSASLRLTNVLETTALVSVEQGPLAVRAGGTVRASTWIKTADVRREGVQQKVCGIYVLFLNKKGEVLSRGESDSAVGTLDWTHLQAEFVAPAGTARARMGLLLGMSGSAWFDDMEFERVD